MGLLESTTNKEIMALNNSQGEKLMPGITKRKDGRYAVRQQKNGIKICKYTKTLTEAKKILSQFRKNLIPFTEEERIAQIIYLKDWMNNYIETYKKPFVTANSYKDIRSAIKPICERLGNIPIKQLTASKIQFEFNKLPKNRTKEKAGIYLNSALQKAYDLNLIERNPFKAVVKDKKIKFKNTAFTYSEQKEILNLIKNTKIECAIYIYLLTGCRPSELPPISNIDLTNKIITINGTKNENALKREIEISENFCTYLQENLNNETLLTHKLVQKEFKEIMQKTKIEKPVLYKLRHTFATNHFTLGTNVKQVQSWMGHSGINITLDIYTDIDKTASKEKIKELYNNFYYIKD